MGMTLLDNVIYSHFIPIYKNIHLILYHYDQQIFFSLVLIVYYGVCIFIFVTPCS